jgi:hypothetical protein
MDPGWETKRERERTIRWKEVRTHAAWIWKQLLHPFFLNGFGL